MESAEEFFCPTGTREFTIIPGEEHWPRGTMMRYHRLLEHFPRTNYVFLIDADMLFEAEVGREILPSPLGITATLHPGYVGSFVHELPFERNEASAAYVAPGESDTYFCGGFVGGRRGAMRTLAKQVVQIIEIDQANGLIPTWHDESALNKMLALSPPEVILDPGFCCPQNDSWYRSVWPEPYERKITALDKSADERGDR